MPFSSEVYVYITAGVIAVLVLSQVMRRSFDPFAPIWLFLVGYFQIYVVQALSYRQWALKVHTTEVLTTADLRALWALLLFLAVYYSPLGKMLARRLPRPPTRWSPGAVWGASPFMVGLGLLAAGWGAAYSSDASYEEGLLRSFPLIMLVAGLLLLITGRNGERPQPAATVAGVAIIVVYTLIWMFLGKRSPALIAVLTGVAAWYLPRFRRPSKVVLAATAFVGVLVVALAIGWRGNQNYEQSASGFAEYLGDFELGSILVSINVKDRPEIENDPDAYLSYETEEWGGYLVMLKAVPELAEHDYGAPYVRLVSTFIPRNVWPSKPYFGREKWIAAWIAGSEFPRDETFTGPAIYTEAAKYKKIEFKAIEKNEAEYDKKANNGWAGMVQHYFVSAWLVGGDAEREFRIAKVRDNLYSVAVVLPLGEVAPGPKYAHNTVMLLAVLIGMLLILFSTSVPVYDGDRLFYRTRLYSWTY